MNSIALAQAIGSSDKKTEKTRKIIDLPNDICRRLAVQAAAMDTSVKKLIESMVITCIEDTDDEAIYAYLCQTQPDGNVMISDEEAEEFEEWLRKAAEES
ncbi:hypothetical protein [uncultured Muribaculum sp.]|uniref:hypothetical protein n=1 Tax=uncultured Muribaculum sp. TaxID=1918613 RepID=UPI00261C61EC|nr:hypothetical protein [uncultured Muribaculum sp.]